MGKIRDERRFADLVGATAAALGLNPVLVEKDYWAVEALRSVRSGFEIELNGAVVRIQPIFKGGTSLSKAFGLIERFSEDVDLLIPVPQGEGGYTQSQRADVLKGCTEAISAALSIDGDRTAGRKGVDRHWRYPYVSIGGDPILGGVEPAIRVEATVMAGANPHSRRSVSSMVADHAATLRDFPAYDDLTLVEIDTLAAERTLVEKLAMLHDASRQALDGRPSRLSGAGRHYYDIAQILGPRAGLEQLNSDWVAEIAADSDRWSEKGKYPFTPRPAGGFAESPAFTDDALAALVRESFDLTMTWVWSDTKPSLNDCIAVIRANRDRL